MAFDQTDPVWLRDTVDGTFGSGVYLCRQWTGSQETLTVQFDEDVTYAQCQAKSKGRAALAFKWVPSTVAVFTQVTNSPCNSSGQDCVDRCPGFSCFCFLGKCVP
jgi:hypothetical protein